jgi:predicted DNA binding CopG/RHH family protein
MTRLTKEEKEILRDFDGGAYRSVATKQELETYRVAAHATALKDRRVNIRISSLDLAGLQTRALQEGLPYQTLIASILHKYLSGRLVEKTSQ